MILSTAFLLAEDNTLTIYKLHMYTNKQTNNIYILFYDMQAPGLHTIQYWNIYKVLVILVKNNKKWKNYLHRGSCTPCGKMAPKENFEQSQNHF